MKRTLLTLVALCLAAAISFAGGTTQSQTAKRTTATGLDISQPVELQFWMLGDAPKDLPAIEAEVNKLAMADLNCTVKYNYTTWTDWSQKYQLLLTSGQPIDLIFTAEWTDYQRYAKAGAYKDITALMPVAAPVLNKFVDKSGWDGVKVGGKIYTVPAMYKEYVYDGFEYREDLRKKYKLPEINSLATMEQYLETVLKNEPGMVGIAETLAANQFSAVMSLTAEMLHPWLDRGMPQYGLAADNAKPREMFPYWGSAEHLADLQLFKRWADKGFWSRSILSSTEDIATMFQTGKLALKMAGINPNKFATDLVAIKATHPEWEIGYYPFSRTTGVVHPVHPTHNGYAVPAASKNPERALAFFEKMVTDKRYNLLTQYGIEGKNYVADNGYYKMVGDSNTNGFGRESMNGWAWRNPEYMLFAPSYDAVKKLFAEFDKVATPDLYNGFAVDYLPFQTEKTALDSVTAQYLAPLQAGLVPDVEAGMAKFMAEAKKAGLEKIQAEYNKQWLAYCDDMGIK
ncbi:MAG TPA: ABC transporter substrate-binding protein [Treponema sp.]|nr:MAG: ABC transporter substrate-binding protein [Treponema sp. GWC1_61_84]OHE69958.1 MAG: ABC transporter substrate-binding protein [Treponema sp. RIFOXYC1_FULL_61_9]HCM28510.1 ABC transporter substrate-binding protein [Treponema sp.]